MKKFARVIVVDEDKNVLIVRQTTSYGKIYCFPGGKVETGERPQFAASREIFEELGIRKKPKDLTPVYRGKFKFNDEEWTGYYYITFKNGMKPSLLEYPKVDKVEFVAPSQLEKLTADHASLSGVLSDIRMVVSDFCREKSGVVTNSGFI